MPTLPIKDGLDNLTKVCNNGVMQGTDTPKGTTTMILTFSNTPGGKDHTNATCGQSRRNMSVNTPRMMDAADLNACAKCGGNYPEATPESIWGAWRTAAKAVKRNDFTEYAKKQAHFMIKANGLGITTYELQMKETS